MSQIKVSPAKLKTTCKAIFEKAGVPDDEAAIIAEVLVDTEGWGVRSHGLMRIEHYIQCILSGGINPSSQLKVDNEGPSWAAINGNGGLGIVTSYKAMNMAIAKAKLNGIAIVNVRNSNHFGAAGYYSMMCAKAGMYGMSMSNVGKIMAITGSSKKSIGNNPFAYAAPAGKYKAIMLDICMSKVADGKVQIARDLGIPLPEGCIIDKDGRPSNDPSDYFSGGTLLPFGDYKGYGLAVMVDCLAGALSGAAILNNVQAWNKDPNRTGTTGHCFIAIDINQIMPLINFEASMEEYITNLKASPTVEGVDRILVPGQLELENEENGRLNGIELLESCVSSLLRTADQLEMALDL